jgi:signal transduction histidine kinase
MPCLSESKQRPPARYQLADLPPDARLASAGSRGLSADQLHYETLLRHNGLVEETELPWRQRYWWVIDVGIAGIVLFASLQTPPAQNNQINLPPLDALATVIVVAAALLVLARRHHPAAMWSATITLALVSAIVTDGPIRCVPAIIVALYTVASWSTRRMALLAAITSAIVVVLSLADQGSLSWTNGALYALVSWCGFAGAIGDAVRSGRVILQQAIDRARIAEQSREEEARLRVAEERLRISRDLHDLVGHHLAVVRVQAGVAQHLFSENPALAQEALVQVKGAAGKALEQTRQLVGLLRTGEDGVLREPTFGIEQLHDLVDSLREAGAAIQWIHSGPELSAPTASSQHMYRIIQEALTNAVKHGSGEVELRTTMAPDQARIVVRNPHQHPSPATAPSGHGLIGMRERVALCNGTLNVAESPQYFELTVVIPFPEGAKS